MSVELEGVIIGPVLAGVTLDDLTDVTITNALTGQVLTYDGVSLQWINANIPPTNLSLGVSTGTTLTIESSTGSDVTLLSASPTFAGLMSSSENIKLAGIQSGATANATDAYLLDRANQTGTQTAATISNFTETTQDTMASTLVAGTNITLVYDDLLGTITISSASGAAGTNLFQGTKTTTTVNVDSSTGAPATLTAATPTIAGVMAAADKAKLDSVQAGATANATDAYLLDRANQTGTQPATTIGDFTSASQNVTTGYLVAGDNITFTIDTGEFPALIINSTASGGTDIIVPQSEIVFGSDTNTITSSQLLTFNTATSELVIGSSVDGEINSGLNQSLTITGDNGLTLVSNSGVVEINPGAGSSTIQSGTSESLTITGDAGLTLVSNSGVVEINPGISSSTIQSGISESLIVTGDNGLTLVSNSTDVIFKVPTGKLVSVFDGPTYDSTLGTSGAVGDSAFVTKSYLNSVIAANGNATVISVFGRDGTVIAQPGDYAAYYATIAQGLLADTSLQPDSSISDLADVDTTTVAPIAGQALVWNNVDWVPGTIATGNIVDSVFGRIGAVVADPSDYAGIYTTPSTPISTFPNDAGYITSTQVPPVVLANTQVAYGDVNDEITSSNTLTFNAALDTLQVGSAGAGLISTDTGQTMTISGDTGLVLQTNSGRVTITTGAALYDLPAADGTAGQAIITDGAGTLSFATISGSSPVSSVFARTGDITADATDYAAFYATVAQGVLADSAIQPLDNISELTNDSGYITLAEVPAQDVNSVFGRTGTILAEANDYASYYASIAQGALADSALQPGDNVSTLNNDAGYITAADIPPDAGVSSFNGRTGVVIAEATDYATFYATIAQGSLADSALQPSNIQVAAGQVAVGSGAGTTEIVGNTSLTYNSNVLTIGDIATDGLVINGTAGVMSITALPNNSDITLSPNGTGAVIIDNGSVNGTISAGLGETLTVESGGDMTITVPDGSVMKVNNVAQYDTALAVNSGDAFITKSYFDTHRNDPALLMRVDAMAQTIERQACVIAQLTEQIEQLLKR